MTAAAAAPASERVRRSEIGEASGGGGWRVRAERPRGMLVGLSGGPWEGKRSGPGQGEKRATRKGNEKWPV